MASMLQLETQMKSEAAGKDMLQILNHLQQALPLKRRRQALPPTLKTVHRSILRSMAETGKPPTQAEIAAMLGSRQSALYALAVLGSNDLVILSSPVNRDEKTKQLRVDERVEVVGAYPMTTESTPHRVVLCGHTVNAMCAVDALAVSPMFGHQAWIESSCHATGAPIRISQAGVQILEVSPSPEIRIGIRWQTAENCAAHTLCTEMVFFKDERVAEAWRQAHGPSVDLLTLSEAVDLGTAFFLPLLEE